MARSETVQTLGQMTVSVSGTINLVKWPNQSGGNGSGYGSFSFTNTYGPGTSFGSSVIASGVSPSSWHQMNGNPYLFSSTPSVVIKATGGATSDDNFKSGATTCQVLLSRNTAGKNGDGTTSSASLSVTQNTVSYSMAQSTVWYYTVTFNDGAGNVLKTQEVRSGGTATAPSNPTRTGYSFNGWSGSYSNVTSDREITATWNIKYKTIRLSYEANGGSFVTGTTQQSDRVQEGTNATFSLIDSPIPPSNKYFVGWLVNGSTYGVGESVSLSSSATATAQYADISRHSIGMRTSTDGLGQLATIKPEPIETVGEEKYWADDVDVVVMPSSVRGYDLDRIVFFEKGKATSIKEVVGSSPFTLDAATRDGRDIVMEFRYAPKTYNFGVSVDAASVGKVTASVSPSSGVPYNNQVTFSATGIAEGYAFSAWYNSDGSQRSTKASYVISAQENLSLSARCKVVCTLDIEYSDEEGDKRSCSFTVGNMAYELGSDIPVELGSSFSYVLNLGNRVGDEKWCLDKITERGSSTPLAYGASGEIKPTAPRYLVAHLASKAATTKILTVNTGVFAQEVSSEGSPYERKWPKDESLVQLTAPYTFQGNVTILEDGDRDPNNPIPDGQYSNAFDGGVQYVRLTVPAKVWFGTDASDKSEQSFRGFYSPDGTMIPSENGNGLSCLLLMASNRSVWVLYGSTTRVVFSVGFASGGNAAMGSVSIESLTDTEEGASIADDGLSANVLQGYKATVRATPSNGYEFVGWYDSDFAVGEPMSTNASYEYTVLAKSMIFAKFRKARNQVCVWEGSNKNKVMTWTSKTHVMSRPFDPVAARVDATSYEGSVGLNVRTMSSPESELSREHQILVSSQDGRRLPRIRPERFVNFTVTASEEVNAVIIGTNMAEVN